MREGIKLAKKLQQCIIQYVFPDVTASPTKLRATDVCDARVSRVHRGVLTCRHHRVAVLAMSSRAALLRVGTAAWRFSAGFGRTTPVSAYGTCRSRTSRTGPCWCASLTAAWLDQV